MSVLEISRRLWFAWYPVWTLDGGPRWLCTVVWTVQRWDDWDGDGSQSFANIYRINRGDACRNPK